MQKNVKDFILACESEIENEDWDEMLRFAHEDALLKNMYLDTVILILESTLDIDLYPNQSRAFIGKFKEVLKAGHPDKRYRNQYGAIKLKSWLLSPFWTNLYGLTLDDAINVLIDNNYNIEETPDEGTLLWIE